MKMPFVILLTVAFVIGCSKSRVESSPEASDSFGKNLCPLAGVSIQKSADGLERTIKIEQDWLGDKLGPMRFTCEASSIERLLEFVAGGPSEHFDGVVGRELLPKGTYRYSFQGRTWDDRTVLVKDVLHATSETFGLALEISHEQGKTMLVIKPVQKVPPKRVEQNRRSALSLNAGWESESAI